MLLGVGAGCRLYGSSQPLNFYAVAVDFLNILDKFLISDVLFLNAKHACADVVDAAVADADDYYDENFDFDFDLILILILMLIFYVMLFIRTLCRPLCS